MFDMSDETYHASTLDERIQQLESENAALKADAMEVEKKMLDEISSLSLMITDLRARLERAEKALRSFIQDGMPVMYYEAAKAYFEESK